MKKKLNIFVYIILSLLLFQNVFWGMAFADDEEECYVCSRMSNEMQMYVNFQVEMIWALSQVHADREIYSWLTKRWLFSYGTLSAGSMFLNSLKNSINKTTQSAVDLTRSLTYATAIVNKNAWTIAFSAEWVGDMLVLFRQKPFMRDRNTLQEIDGSIDDLLWDVWMQGMIKKPVSANILSQVNELALKYTEAEPIFSQFQINGNVSYGKLIFMLNDLNRLMKNFFTTESISVYQKNAKRFEKEISKWDTVIVSFNHEYLTKLSESYTCVKWSKWLKNCGNSFSSFASDVRHIWTDVKLEFESAWKQIKESSKKLAEAWKTMGKVMKNKYVNGWDLWLTDDQVELLSSVYGINVTKLTKQQGLSLATILNWTAWKNILNSMSWSQDIIEGEIKSQKKESKKSNEEETTNNSIAEKDFNKMSTYAKKKSCMKRLNRKSIWSMSQANQNRERKCLEVLWSESFLLKENVWSYVEYYVPNGNVDVFSGMITYLNESIENTLSELDMDKAVVMYSQNLDSTRYFVEMWYYIHGIVDNVIWSKNWASDTIVNNLGKACEAQCTNKWWKCYN